MNIRLYITNAEPIFANENGHQVEPIEGKPTGMFLCDFVEDPTGFFLMGLAGPEKYVQSGKFYQAGENAVLMDNSIEDYTARQKLLPNCAMDLTPIRKLEIRKALTLNREQVVDLKSKYALACVEANTERMAIAAAYDSKIGELRAQALKLLEEKNTAMAAVPNPALEALL